MKLERRSVFGWPASAAGYAPCKNGLVVHYDGSSQGLAGKSHGACREYWKSTRKFHMGSSRGWADIGYSFAACPHGIVMEGRGWQRSQAAQPGGNTTWTSVTLMSGPSESPTSAQINAVRELRAYLRARGLGAGVRGHRDFISTSCPGTKLYALVKNGTFTGSPSGGGASTPSEESPLIGTKEGDSGQDVKAVQALIEYAGQSVGKAGVDGQWGPGTSAGLLAVRKSVGSKETSAKVMTGWAYAQLMVAVARKQGGA